MHAISTYFAASLLLASWLVRDSNAQSVTASPAVIELFTSQGCSSCPPADALLGELAQRANVLALAFHVNYWDELGWKDRFASPAATQRQYDYVRALGLSAAFTPQAVVNGKISVLGSDRRQLQSLLDDRPHAASLTLNATSSDIVIGIDAAPAASPQVWLVSYLSQAETAIPRGENAGRSLREFNVVRSLQPLNIAAAITNTIHVPRNTLPNDATHVAVLIQAPHQGAILAAASIAL